MNPKDQSTQKEKPASIPKIQTRIRGLDDILYGGLPARRTTIVSGTAGTGKTVLAMEFLYQGALEGKPGIFISFEESAEDLRANAAGMGMDIESLENADKLKVIHAELPHDTILAGEFDTMGLLAMIEGHADMIGADRIVLDAIDVLMWIFDDPARERKEIFLMHEKLKDLGLTTILTVKVDPVGRKIYPFLDFMADCVLFLDQRMYNHVRTRRLNVVKYRGSNFLNNEHPYVLSEHGLSAIPVSSMDLGQFPFAERISTGHDGLDQMLNGGFFKGSSVLLAGPSGSGKTSLACIFAHAACSRGEKVLYVDFEVAGEVLISGVQSIGLDMRPVLEGENRLHIMTLIPESLGPEQHLLKIIDEINQFIPDHLVVDAISACRRMGGEQAAFDFIFRLMSMCKTRGITCIFTNQTTGDEHVTEISGIGVSSLVDVIIALEYYFSEKKMKRQLVVLKTRGSAHSMEYCQMHITDSGIRLCDEPVKNFENNA